MQHSDVIEFGVLCEECGQRTPKTIGRLTIHNNLPCHNCGALVDLTAGQNATVIQKLTQQCAELDAIAAKRN